MVCRAVSKFNLSINDINYIKDKEYEYRLDVDGYIIKGENDISLLNMMNVSCLAEGFL